jgi:hypothetical protein
MILVPVGERIDALLLGIEGTNATLTLTLATARDTGQPALWVTDLRGGVGFRPKRNLELMRAVLAECETIARSNEALELRIEANSRKSWKRRLLPALGFVAHKVGDRLVMRKVLYNG